MFRAICSNVGAERSHVVKSAKPGKPPPAEPREARREGAGGTQRRATRFAAGRCDPPPLRETCERECELPPKAFPRNASCPPRGRGNERFLLSFNGCARSVPAPGTVRSPAPRGCDSLRYHNTTIARHACRNSRFRPARVPRNHFPRCNPRAVLEIKYNRFPLHKHPVSTSPLPLLSAFLQPSAFRERSDSSRPCLPTQSGRADTRFPGELRSPAPACRG